MSDPLSTNRSLSCWAAALLLVSLVAGCKPAESIESYRVPRQYIEDEQQAEKAALAAMSGKGPGGQAAGPMAPGMAAPPAGGRMLAAIVDHGAQAWFFKLTGAPAAVGTQADAFNTLIKSVHFAAGDDAKPEWTLPTGWTEKGGSGIRHNTLVTPGPEPLEVSVTVLPKSGDDDAYALSNINRWRRQLKLPPIGAEELARETTRLPLATGTAIVVDLLAAEPSATAATATPTASDKPATTDKPVPAAPPEKGAASDRMLAAIVPQGDKAWFFKLTGPADAVKARDAEFQAFLKSIQFSKEADAKPEWKVPDGWLEQAASGMRYATLLIGGGEKPLELSVTVLPKPPGDEAEYMLSNINRWRGQMQLPPIGKDALAAESTTLDTAGGKATVVNLLGTAAAGGMQRGPFQGGAK